jgi:hypothetical protein
METMMSRDNLLKDAIADARAIRDAAIANAKLTLEEQFKPQLSSMLSARLRNEIEGINEDNDDTSAIGVGLTVDEPAPKKPSAATSDSSHIENKGLETDTLGEGFEDELEDPATDPAVDPTAAPSLDAGADMGIAPDAGMGADAGIDGLDAPAGDASFGAETSEDELDLDAIIRELELDVQDGEGDEAGMAGMAAPAPRVESFQDANAGAEVDGALDGSLKEEAEGVSSDGKSPADCEGVPGGKKVTAGQEVTEPGAEATPGATKVSGVNEEVDLDEILREMEAEESSSVLESEKIAAENVELKRNLREHREVIQFLRGKIQEVNMLNSKLLYTNRLFRAFDLDNSKKMRVVETFDRATTVREVKLIYTTLAESFSGKTIPAGKQKVAKTITEGMASKPTGSTKPKSTQILAEGNDMVARMQKLAGINR